jgi:hypothetical protein
MGWDLILWHNHPVCHHPNSICTDYEYKEEAFVKDENVMLKSLYIIPNYRPYFNLCCFDRRGGGF